MHYYKDYEEIQSSWKMGTFLGNFSTNNYENNCFCKTHPRLRENKMVVHQFGQTADGAHIHNPFNPSDTICSNAYANVSNQLHSDQWNIKRIQYIISKLKVILHTKQIPSKLRDANSGKQHIGKAANLAGIQYSYLYNLCTMHNAIRNCSCRNTCHPISHYSLGVPCYLCLCIYTTWKTPILQRTCNLHSPVNWTHLQNIQNSSNMRTDYIRHYIHTGGDYTYRKRL